MRNMLRALAVTGGSLVLIGDATAAHAIRDVSEAPEFTHHATDEWINSQPLTLQGLKGRVVLVEFWTFACHNCHRSVPWINGVNAKYESRGLQTVGIHTPELPQERIAANVRSKVDEYQIRFPVMLDEDYSYWEAFSNQYWPAFYLIDKKGRLRTSYFGETHAGDTQARRIEADIEALIAEPS